MSEKTPGRGGCSGARVWTDGSLAWEPCSSCEERRGTAKGDGGDGRERRRVEGGSVGGSGGAHRRCKSCRILQGGFFRDRRGSDEAARGMKFFRGLCATCRIETLVPPTSTLSRCSFHSSSVADVSRLFQRRRRNNPLLGQTLPARFFCQPRSLLPPRFRRESENSRLRKLDLS